MHRQSGYTDSYYSASIREQVNTGRLDGNREADVCVIGGGYTGLSAALHLAEQGRQVVLLEANKLGWGASGRNGGQMGVGQRRDQAYLEKHLGPEKARRLWEIGLESVDLAKQLISRHGIQCDLKPGILHVAHKPSYIEGLKADTSLLQDRYHYDRIRFIDGDELGEMVGSRAFYAGQLDMGSAHLHPLNYALGIGRTAASAGAELYEDSPVTGYHENNGVVIETPSGTVRARHLVLACNGYLDNLEKRVNGYIMPINNYVIATEPLPEQLCRELIRDDVGIQDSRFVINYWRLSADNRLLFGGGENYRRGFPADIRAFVRKYMLKIYPQLEPVRIDYGWGGTLAITLYRLPHFGKLSDNIWFAQGYSGHGIAMGTLAGKLIADAMAGNDEKFAMMADLPTPRFPGGTLLRWPGMVAGMLYYALRDRL